MIQTLVAILAVSVQVPQNQKVSDKLTPSGQFLKPLGKQVNLPARPVDMAVHPTGKWLFVKENRGLTVIELGSWRVIQELASPGGASQTGLVIDSKGARIWFSNAASTVHEGAIDGSGKVKWIRKLDVPKPKIGGESYPTGMALSKNERQLVVCASRSNQIVRMDLGTGKVQSTLDTDIAPFDLAFSKDQSRLYVSCWGGKKAATGAKTAPSAGTQVEVDARGIAKGATVAVHDIESGKSRSIPTGLQPSEIVVAPDGRAFVANANDDTVTEISADLQRVNKIVVKPNLNLPFGSAPNALLLDGKTLYVACGGNNSVAVLDVQGEAKLMGFLPVGWYPSAIQKQGGNLLVANAKGFGSRRKQPSGNYGVYGFTGTVLKISKNQIQSLKDHTATVNRLNETKTILKAREAVVGKSNRSATAVPARLGDPSLIKHVVYVIKENRTYDQVFGDMPQGDGDPKLCIFGRNVTPNHHALAEQFVLLDNYYCNGVLSADGHAWSVEGNATSHFERSFGGWTRSYPFGDDPLSPSTTGFLWDNVLKHGKTFRNYGEFNYTDPVPKNLSFKKVFDDWKSGANQVKFTHNIGVERLRRYSNPNAPGWNMNIPDGLRADHFIKEVKQFDQAGYFPNLTILYLPQDHTSGTTPGEPTPRATLADNDLALGRSVEALSKTKFWKNMAIFVIEDDPQDGFDHVDGHRSVCLVISPYSRTKKVISQFYNQTSVLATMQRILGIPPMNQMDARAPIMSACFVNKGSFAPYQALANNIPLDELNPPRSALKGEALKWADVSASLPRHKPDLMGAKECDLFNRAIWFAMKGSQPYPSEWAGAHGRGLKKRGLSFGDADSD